MHTTPAPLVHWADRGRVHPVDPGKPNPTTLVHALITCPTCRTLAAQSIQTWSA
jgi:hypothetical protein